MLLQSDVTFVTYDRWNVAILRKVSLLVPTLAQAIVYKRLPRGRGWNAQLKTQGSVESESWPRLFICVSAINSRGMHVNAGGDLGPDFARMEFAFEGGQRSFDFPL